MTAKGGTLQVMLSWEKIADATSYNIYKGTVKGGESKVTPKTVITATSCTDPNLVAGKPYFYQITAVNSAEESQRSKEVSATPSK